MSPSQRLKTAGLAQARRETQRTFFLRIAGAFARTAYTVFVYPVIIVIDILARAPGFWIVVVALSIVSVLIQMDPHSFVMRSDKAWTDFSETVGTPVRVSLRAVAMVYSAMVAPYNLGVRVSGTTNRALYESVRTSTTVSEWIEALTSLAVNAIDDVNDWAITGRFYQSPPDFVPTAFALQRVLALAFEVLISPCELDEQFLRAFMQPLQRNLYTGLEIPPRWDAVACQNLTKDLSYASTSAVDCGWCSEIGPSSRCLPNGHELFEGYAKLGSGLLELVISAPLRFVFAECGLLDQILEGSTKPCYETSEVKNQAKFQDAEVIRRAFLNEKPFANGSYCGYSQSKRVVPYVTAGVMCPDYVSIMYGYRRLDFDVGFALVADGADLIGQAVDAWFDAMVGLIQRRVGVRCEDRWSARTRKTAGSCRAPTPPIFRGATAVFVSLPLYLGRLVWRVLMYSDVVVYGFVVELGTYDKGFAHTLIETPVVEACDYVDAAWDFFRRTVRVSNSSEPCRRHYFAEGVERQWTDVGELVASLTEKLAGSGRLIAKAGEVLSQLYQFVVRVVATLGYGSPLDAVSTYFEAPPSPARPAAPLPPLICAAPRIERDREQRYGAGAWIQAACPTWKDWATETRDVGTGWRCGATRSSSAEYRQYGGCEDEVSECVLTRRLPDVDYVEDVLDDVPRDVFSPQLSYAYYASETLSSGCSCDDLWTEPQPFPLYSCPTAELESFEGEFDVCVVLTTDDVSGVTDFVRQAELCPLVARTSDGRMYDPTLTKCRTARVTSLTNDRMRRNTTFPLTDPGRVFRFPPGLQAEDQRKCSCSAYTYVAPTLMPTVYARCPTVEEAERLSSSSPPPPLYYRDGSDPAVTDPSRFCLTSERRAFLGFEMRRPLSSLTPSGCVCPLHGRPPISADDGTSAVFCPRYCDDTSDVEGTTSHATCVCSTELKSIRDAFETASDGEGVVSGWRLDDARARAQLQIERVVLHEGHARSGIPVYKPDIWARTPKASHARPTPRYRLDTAVCSTYAKNATAVLEWLNTSPPRNALDPSSDMCSEVVHTPVPSVWQGALPHTTNFSATDARIREDPSGYRRWSVLANLRYDTPEKSLNALFDAASAYGNVPGFERLNGSETSWLPLNRSSSWWELWVRRGVVALPTSDGTIGCIYPLANGTAAFAPDCFGACEDAGAMETIGVRPSRDNETRHGMMRSDYQVCVDTRVLCLHTGSPTACGNCRAAVTKGDTGDVCPVLPRLRALPSGPLSGEVRLLNARRCMNDDVGAVVDEVAFSASRCGRLYDEVRLGTNKEVLRYAIRVPSQDLEFSLYAGYATDTNYIYACEETENTTEALTASNDTLLEDAYTMCNAGYSDGVSTLAEVFPNGASTERMNTERAAGKSPTDWKDWPVRRTVADDSMAVVGPGALVTLGADFTSGGYVQLVEPGPRTGSKSSRTSRYPTSVFAVSKGDRFDVDERTRSSEEVISNELWVLEPCGNLEERTRLNPLYRIRAHVSGRVLKTTGVTFDPHAHTRLTNDPLVLRTGLARGAVDWPPEAWVATRSTLPFRATRRSVSEAEDLRIVYRNGTSDTAGPLFRSDLELAWDLESVELGDVDEDGVTGMFAGGGGRVNDWESPAVFVANRSAPYLFASEENHTSFFPHCVRLTRAGRVNCTSEISWEKEEMNGDTLASCVALLINDNGTFVWGVRRCDEEFPVACGTATDTDPAFYPNGTYDSARLTCAASAVWTPLSAEQTDSTHRAFEERGLRSVWIGVRRVPPPTFTDVGNWGVCPKTTTKQVLKLLRRNDTDEFLKRQYAHSTLFEVRRTSAASTSVTLRGYDPQTWRWEPLALLNNSLRVVGRLKSRVFASTRTVVTVNNGVHTGNSTVTPEVKYAWLATPALFREDAPIDAFRRPRMAYLQPDDLGEYGRTTNSRVDSPVSAVQVDSEIRPCDGGFCAFFGVRAVSAAFMLSLFPGYDGPVRLLRLNYTAEGVSRLSSTNLAEETSFPLSANRTLNVTVSGNFSNGAGTVRAASFPGVHKLVTRFDTRGTRSLYTDGRFDRATTNARGGSFAREPTGFAVDLSTAESSVLEVSDNPTVIASPSLGGAHVLAPSNCNNLTNGCELLALVSGRVLGFVENRLPRRPFEEATRDVTHPAATFGMNGVKPDINGSVFTNRSLTHEWRVWYQFTCVDGEGGESEPYPQVFGPFTSRHAWGYLAPGTSAPTVLIVKADATTDWNPCGGSGALLRVYRAEAEAGPFVAVAPTSTARRYDTGAFARMFESTRFPPLTRPPATATTRYLSGSEDLVSSWWRLPWESTRESSQAIGHESVDLTEVLSMNCTVTVESGVVTTNCPRWRVAGEDSVYYSNSVSGTSMLGLPFHVTRKDAVTLRWICTGDVCNDGGTVRSGALLDYYAERMAAVGLDPLQWGSLTGTASSTSGSSLRTFCERAFVLNHTRALRVKSTLGPGAFGGVCETGAAYYRFRGYVDFEATERFDVPGFRYSCMRCGDSVGDWVSSVSGAKTTVTNGPLPLKTGVRLPCGVAFVDDDVGLVPPHTARLAVGTALRNRADKWGYVYPTRSDDYTTRMFRSRNADVEGPSIEYALFKGPVAGLYRHTLKYGDRFAGTADNTLKHECFGDAAAGFVPPVDAWRMTLEYRGRNEVPRLDTYKDGGFVATLSGVPKAVSRDRFVQTCFDACLDATRQSETPGESFHCKGVTLVWDYQSVTRGSVYNFSYTQKYQFNPKYANVNESTIDLINAHAPYLNRTLPLSEVVHIETDGEAGEQVDRAERFMCVLTERALAEDRARYGTDSAWSNEAEWRPTTHMVVNSSVSFAPFANWTNGTFLGEDLDHAVLLRHTLHFDRLGWVWHELQKEGVRQRNLVEHASSKARELLVGVSQFQTTRPCLCPSNDSYTLTPTLLQEGSMFGACVSSMLAVTELPLAPLAPPSAPDSPMSPPPSAPPHNPPSYPPNSPPRLVDVVLVRRRRLLQACEPPTVIYTPTENPNLRVRVHEEIEPCSGSQQTLQARFGEGGVLFHTAPTVVMSLLDHDLIHVDFNASAGWTLTFDEPISGLTLDPHTDGSSGFPTSMDWNTSSVLSLSRWFEPLRSDSPFAAAREICSFYGTSVSGRTACCRDVVRQALGGGGGAESLETHACRLLTGEVLDDTAGMLVLFASPTASRCMLYNQAPETLWACRPECTAIPGSPGCAASPCAFDESKLCDVAIVGHAGRPFRFRYRATDGATTLQGELILLAERTTLPSPPPPAPLPPPRASLPPMPPRKRPPPPFRPPPPPPPVFRDSDSEVWDLVRTLNESREVFIAGPYTAMNRMANTAYSNSAEGMAIDAHAQHASLSLLAETSRACLDAYVHAITSLWRHQLLDADVLNDAVSRVFAQAVLAGRSVISAFEWMMGPSEAVATGESGSVCKRARFTNMIMRGSLKMYVVAADACSKSVRVEEYACPYRSYLPEACLTAERPSDTMSAHFVCALLDLVDRQFKSAMRLMHSATRLNVAVTSDLFNCFLGGSCSRWTRSFLRQVGDMQHLVVCETFHTTHAAVNLATVVLRLLVVPFYAATNFDPSLRNLDSVWVAMDDVHTSGFSEPQQNETGGYARIFPRCESLLQADCVRAGNGASQYSPVDTSLDFWYRPDKNSDLKTGHIVTSPQAGDLLVRGCDRGWCHCLWAVPFETLEVWNGRSRAEIYVSSNRTLTSVLEGRGQAMFGPSVSNLTWSAYPDNERNGLFAPGVCVSGCAFLQALRERENSPSAGHDCGRITTAGMSSQNLRHRLRVDGCTLMRKEESEPIYSTVRLNKQSNLDASLFCSSWKETLQQYPLEAGLATFLLGVSSAPFYALRASLDFTRELFIDPFLKSTDVHTILRDYVKTLINMPTRCITYPLTNSVLYFRDLVQGSLQFVRALGVVLYRAGSTAEFIQDFFEIANKIVSILQELADIANSLIAELFVLMVEMMVEVLMLMISCADPSMKSTCDMIQKQIVETLNKLLDLLRTVMQVLLDKVILQSPLVNNLVDLAEETCEALNSALEFMDDLCSDVKAVGTKITEAVNVVKAEIMGVVDTVAGVAYDVRDAFQKAERIIKKAAGFFGISYRRRRALLATKRLGCLGMNTMNCVIQLNQPAQFLPMEPSMCQVLTWERLLRSYEYKPETEPKMLGYCNYCWAAVPEVDCLLPADETSDTLFRFEYPDMKCVKFKNAVSCTADPLCQWQYSWTNASTSPSLDGLCFALRDEKTRYYAKPCPCPACRDGYFCSAAGYCQCGRVPENALSECPSEGKMAFAPGGVHEHAMCYVRPAWRCSRAFRGCEGDLGDYGCRMTVGACLASVLSSGRPALCREVCGASVEDMDNVLLHGVLSADGREYGCGCAVALKRVVREAIYADESHFDVTVLSPEPWDISKVNRRRLLSLGRVACDDTECPACPQAPFAFLLPEQRRRARCNPNSGECECPEYFDPVTDAWTQFSDAMMTLPWEIWEHDPNTACDRLFVEFANFTAEEVPDTLRWCVQRRAVIWFLSMTVPPRDMPQELVRTLLPLDLLEGWRLPSHVLEIVLTSTGVTRSSTLLKRALRWGASYLYNATFRSSTSSTRQRTQPSHFDYFQHSPAGAVLVSEVVEPNQKVEQRHRRRSLLSFQSAYKKIGLNCEVLEKTVTAFSGAVSLVRRHFETRPSSKGFVFHDSYCAFERVSSFVPKTKLCNTTAPSPPPPPPPLAATATSFFVQRWFDVPLRWANKLRTYDSFDVWDSVFQKNKLALNNQDPANPANYTVFRDYSVLYPPNIVRLPTTGQSARVAALWNDTNPAVLVTSDARKSDVPDLARVLQRGGTRDFPTRDNDRRHIVRLVLVHKKGSREAETAPLVNTSFVPLLDYLARNLTDAHAHWTDNPPPVVESRPLYQWGNRNVFRKLNFLIVPTGVRTVYFDATWYHCDPPTAFDSSTTFVAVNDVCTKLEPWMYTDTMAEQSQQSSSSKIFPVSVPCDYEEVHMCTKTEDHASEFASYIVNGGGAILLLYVVLQMLNFPLAAVIAGVLSLVVVVMAMYNVYGVRMACGMYAPACFGDDLASAILDRAFPSHIHWPDLIVPSRSADGTPQHVPFCDTDEAYGAFSNGARNLFYTLERLSPGWASNSFWRVLDRWSIEDPNRYNAVVRRNDPVELARHDACLKLTLLGLLPAMLGVVLVLIWSVVLAFAMLTILWEGLHVVTLGIKSLTSSHRELREMDRIKAEARRKNRVT